MATKKDGAKGAAAGEPLEGLKFEQGLEKLESILETLENEELSLEDSIKNYETGVKYYNFCKEKLDALEKKIEMLVKSGQDGDYTAVPFRRDEIDGPRGDN